MYTVHLTCVQDEPNPNISRSCTVLHQQYLTACLPVWVPHLCPAHWVFPVGVWNAVQDQEGAGHELYIHSPDLQISFHNLIILMTLITMVHYHSDGRLLVTHEGFGWDVRNW